MLRWEVFVYGEKRSTNGDRVENAKVGKTEAILGEISLSSN